jgi:hypothetical protein
VDFHCLQRVPEVFSQLNQSDHFLTLHYLALLVLTVRADDDQTQRAKIALRPVPAATTKKESERWTDETEDKFLNSYRRLFRRPVEWGDTICLKHSFSHFHFISGILIAFSTRRLRFRPKWAPQNTRCRKCG